MSCHILQCNTVNAFCHHIVSRVSSQFHITDWCISWSVCESCLSVNTNYKSVQVLYDLKLATSQPNYRSACYSSIFKLYKALVYIFLVFIWPYELHLAFLQLLQYAYQPYMYMLPVEVTHGSHHVAISVSPVLLSMSQSVWMNEWRNEWCFY